MGEHLLVTTTAPDRETAARLAEEGRLNTVNTWRHKPPAVTTIPLKLNTHLSPRDLAAEVPENPANVLSSKDVGEPPLVLATSGVPRGEGRGAGIAGGARAWTACSG